jgi:hypothetical protein
MSTLHLEFSRDGHKSKACQSRCATVVFYRDEDEGGVAENTHTA